MIRNLAADLLRLRNALSRCRQQGGRGMAAFTDTIDWLGGRLCEVGKPEQILTAIAYEALRGAPAPAALAATSCFSRRIASQSRGSP
jgi:hypothetical protein